MVYSVVSSLAKSVCLLFVSRQKTARKSKSARDILLPSQDPEQSGDFLYRLQELL